LIPVAIRIRHAPATRLQTVRFIFSSLSSISLRQLHEPAVVHVSLNRRLV
jgi:hypothetical protein